MNRAAVYLLGAIVLLGVAVVGGGVYFLFGTGGDAGTGTPTAVDATPLDLTPTPTAQAPTPTPTAQAPTPTGTQTAAGSPTPTDAVRTNILPRRFDRRRIEVLVVEEINERRRAEGLEPLTGNGTVAKHVRTMARNHSVNMADEGVVRHQVNGTTSTARYRDYNLYRTCRWDAANGDYIIASDKNGYEANKSALEAVGRTYAGREYGDGQFNEDERAVAEALVDAFFSDYRFDQRLTLPRATHAGVGAEITQAGEVYVTVDLCNPS
jgi:hypothetical protein